MQNLIGRVSAALVIAALLVPTQSLQAQRKGQWNVTPRLGLVFWDDAAAIQDPVLGSSECDFPQFDQTCVSVANSLMAGISAMYNFTERFAVGLSFDVARPVTNGAYFPAASMVIAGQDQLTFVNQRLTILQYQVQGDWAPDWRLAPVVLAAIGGYTVYPDPPKADFASVTGFNTRADLMYSIGVGVDWNLGASGGLRLTLVDMIYTGWDRDQLNPVAPQFQTTVWPDLVPAPPAAASTLHNFNLALAFTFVPGGRR